MAFNNERVTIKDTSFIFRTNFRGVPTDYNQNGYKEFNVILPDDIAEELEAKGWNVKHTRPREEGDESVAHIQVRVNFDVSYPPRVWLINADTGKRTMLDDETIGQLDFLSRDEIVKVNLIINPRHWSNPNGSGIKAYCHSMQVYFLPDPFEAEYEAQYGSKSSSDDDVPFD